MQEGGVGGIDADLERLQPVALEQTFEGESIGVRRGETIEFRKCRRLAFAEIGPENSTLLHHGIGALPDPAAQL